MEQPPNRVEAWQALIDRYNETDPEFPVEQQVQDWNQIYTKIAGAVQSNTQPDILFTIPDFTTYVRPLGKVRPVTDVVEELDGEHRYIEAATAPYTDEDEVWAVPMYGMVQMLWYREDLLAEAGITEAPETWEDLLAAAEAATGDGRSGIALPAGKNLATDQVIYSFMLTNGAGDFFTEDGQPDFDRPEVVETFEFYDRLMEFSPPDSANYSWGEPQAAFNSGAAAMAIEKGQYLMPFEEESGRPAEDLGCAPIPQPADGGQPGSIYYSNAAMVLSEDDARAEAAEDFLAWLLQPENYGEFLNAEPGLFLPLTEDGVEAESWTSHEVITTYRDCVDQMLEQSRSGALFGFVGGQYVDEIGNISGQNVLAQVIQQIAVEGRDPAEAVAAGQQMMLDAVQG
ncbi:ABC transporter substrate-binding protein [Geodermatophilus maliterrae]|uniref:ABC transporter substrate-binding protein n=1 Tax=Geodermatophilus maliterrae TaxID=3162531 RepID=A0ABV3XB77_9ACTN